MGAYFGNRTLQGIGNILNGGFPWRPGTVAQQGGTPSDLTLPNLPGPASGMDFHSMSNVLGTQGAFQQLMKSNGYSLENALARPSAEQAYSILRSSGLDAGSAQQLLKSNGYHLDDATQLPGLLGDGEKDLLQRTEGSSGEMLELPKIGEEFKDSGGGIEKLTQSDILLPKRNQSNGVKVNIQLFGTPKYSEMHTNGLKKSERSFEKRISEHKEKIANPAKVYPEWGTLNAEEQRGSIEHWKKEIKLFENQLEAVRAELKKRGF